MPEKIKALRVPPRLKPQGRTPINQTKWERCRRYALSLRRQEAAKKNEALCEHCAMEGRQYYAQPVEGHHRIARRIRPDLTYALENIQFLCKRHHILVTHLENAEKFPNRHVVLGKPNSDKTALVQSRKIADARVWDADAVATSLGMGAYPRSVEDEQTLLRLRDKFLEDLKGYGGEVWVILSRPKTAYQIPLYGLPGT